MPWTSRSPTASCACALAIDPASRQVRLHGALVVLSQKEFALLTALAAEPTRVFATVHVPEAVRLPYVVEVAAVG